MTILLTLLLTICAVWSLVWVADKIITWWQIGRFE